MTDNERLEQLFREQQYMVIAVTLEDGTPWALPVRIVRRDRTIFEWDSHLQAEHSKVLAINPSMAVTLFQMKDAEQIGFYAKGKGELLEEFKPGFGHYRFTAEQSWINDESFVKRSIQL